MSVMKNVIDLLIGQNLGFGVKAGKYPDNAPPNGISGKVIFAGGAGVSSEDKPRNVMGGEVLRAELFKVILRGESYVALEESFGKVKIALRQAGYIQLSGFEHVEPKDDGLLQLAVMFKTVNQN